MNQYFRLVLICVLLLFVTGCMSPQQNKEITVSDLNAGGFLQDAVGEFEVYTGSFRIANPTNSTFENVRADITLVPTATYCHGLTKSFTIPRLNPLEKKTVEISIAEFRDLGCQYDFTYQVFS